MAVMNKFDQFVLDLASGVHNLNAAALKILLTNAAPVRTNKVKADLTEIAAGNGYAAGGNAALFNSGGDAAGLYKLVLAPVAFTAAGGNIGPFEFAVLYNASNAAGNLIGWWDYGLAITLTNGNTFTVQLDQANGVLTLQ